MDPRVLTLALPSTIALVLLVVHSVRSLPPRRALAFWTSAALYGVARGIAVRLVTERGLGASFPYVIRKPLFAVLGVSLQEVAGWAIVAYLGWWLGWRFARALEHAAPGLETNATRKIAGRGTAPEIRSARPAPAHASARKRDRDDRGPARAEGSGVRPVPGPRLFVQVLWGAIFLGAISWGVESTAGAAGWWTWTVPTGGSILLGVPFIGLVDWFFVGIDFLLPFLVLSSDAWRGRAARWAVLGVFPLHFVSHVATGRVAPAVPVPIFHLVHWALIGGVVWLALRSRQADPGFAHETPASAWLPLAGAGIVLADAALVQGVLVGRPELLVSLAPATVMVLAAFSLAGSATGAAVCAGLAIVWPSLILALVPAGAGMLLLLAARRRSRWLAPATLGALVVVALSVHVHAARREADLTARLDAALAARDRGDLSGAVAALEAVARDHPGSHAVRGLVGEIDYRLNRLDRARNAFLEAVAIKPDFVMGHRYLAVIDLQSGRLEDAASRARAGLSWAPHDAELLYVRDRAEGGSGREAWDRAMEGGPGGLLSLSSLAAETGDGPSAAIALDRALDRWSDRRELFSARVGVALEQGDEEAARRVVASWLRQFPDDRDASALQQRLGTVAGRRSGS